MKEIVIRYSAEFLTLAEVPDDWEFDGTLSQIMEVSDLPYDDGFLIDWTVDQ